MGLGGALGAIFAAGEVDKDDRKLRNIQDVSRLEVLVVDRQARIATTVDKKARMRTRNEIGIVKGVLCDPC